MPGADDTLNAVDPLDELCTCGHTKGAHSTIADHCLLERCDCLTFEAVTDDQLAEFVNRGRLAQEAADAVIAEVEAGADIVNEDVGGDILDTLTRAHADAVDEEIGGMVRELTDDLPGGEGRIGEIKGELDQILDAALLCTDSNCGHRRDRHKHDGCNDCDCPTFLEPSDPSPDAVRRATRPEMDAALDKAVGDFNEEHGVDLLADTLRSNEALDEEQFVDAQREARDGAAMGTLDQPAGAETFLGAAWTGTRKSNTHSNTREAVDRLMAEEHRRVGTPMRTHDDHARAMDAEAMSPTEGMTEGERTESDAVQAETLDNLCTCGHRYGDHWVDDQCSRPGCECDEFEALLKPADSEFVHDSPIDPEAIARATRGPADVQVGNLAETDTLLPDDVRPTDEQVAAFVTGRPFRNTCCLKCGHEAEEHAANGTVCHVEGCDCEALVEYTGGVYVVPEGADIIENAEAHRPQMTVGDVEDVFELPPGTMEKVDPEWKRGHDGRKPYTPPLLRKKYIGEGELRKILADAGRLPLLEEIPEVDRVTVNYGVEHWQRIERLARNPQGSSETNTASDRTTKAIAIALLDLRQCLGASHANSDAMVSVLQKNAETIAKTTEVLDMIVKRLTKSTGDETPEGT